MTTKPNTNCESKGLCYYDSSRRTKFFHGMLLTDEHLRAEQQYHRDALRRVNRYLWGTGTVCGLEIEHTTGLCIKVHPGLALDCHGNVVELCKPVTIDLWDLCRQEQPEGCGSAKPLPKLTRVLALRYAEIEDDPVPVFTPAEDCTSAGEQDKCLKSRVREGFCFEFLDKCHDAPQPAPRTGLVDCMKRSQPCPACACDCGCGDCWIGLGTVTIDCDKKTVEVTCACRDEVQSPRRLREQLAHDYAKLHEQIGDVYALVRRNEANHEGYANAVRAQIENLRAAQHTSRDRLNGLDEANDLRRDELQALRAQSGDQRQELERVTGIMDDHAIEDLKQQVAALKKQVDTLKAQNKTKAAGGPTPP